MSVVLNLLVLAEMDECGIAMREGFTDSGGRRVNFGDLAADEEESPGRPCDFWGGGKVPEVSVWAGAFNHADVDEIVAWVRALPWLDQPLIVWRHEWDEAWKWNDPLAVDAVSDSSA